MAQLADSALFDLADTLAGHFELTANLFKRVILIVVKSKAQRDDLALAHS